MVFYLMTIYRILKKNFINYYHQILNILNNHETLQKEERALFPFLQLPIDLVTETSLYLNEDDIFQFEQCCRLFYTMINNTTYLKQSNTFNTFTIDNTIFKQLTQSQYSFFKYSKAMTLEFCNSTHFGVEDDMELIDEFF